ncbi:MAG: BMP family ABC transporter substrate-binding protein [Proteobacteria bacterium]|nr:BMP family ABC transporter substrate-binding protein [Pseudomonadota bacterium]NIS67639.1 BMP family ABC transporter substrate-binding protein [Pseudomonadota bacterium]
MRWTIFRFLLSGTLLLGPTLVGRSGALETPCGGPLRVAIILPASRADQGWNQQGADSLESLKKKWCLTIEIAENQGYGDIKPVIRDLADKGFNLIIAHASGYQTTAPEVAAEKGVRVVTIENAKAVKPGLVSDIDTEAQGAAYLAGIAAGKVTRAGIVGIVVSAEPPTWNRMSAGFMEGLYSVRPDARLLYNVIGDAAYEDAAGGKRNVEAQIAAGADVIFGQGDGASFGMMSACSENKAKDGGKVWFIDVIGDKRNIDKKGILLTSVLFDYAPIYEQMFINIYIGTFGQEHVLNVANNGVRLMDFHPDVPQYVKDSVENARQGIVSGKIKVSNIPDSTGLKTFRARLFPR